MRHGKLSPLVFPKVASNSSLSEFIFKDLSHVALVPKRLVMSGVYAVG